MYNANAPLEDELPSTAKLIKSTIVAVVTAAFLLITVVLPAEYGIDPTGIGERLGLKKMGEIKTSLAAEAAMGEVATAANSGANAADKAMESPDAEAANSVDDSTSSKSARQDSLTLTLEPNAGVEVKAIMQKGDRLTYSWSSSGGKVNFDVHGDSQNLAIKYHNYEKGSVVKKESEIVAAFDGSHGWFWRNRSGKTVQISLQVSGNYEALQRVQ